MENQGFRVLSLFQTYYNPGQVRRINHNFKVVSLIGSGIGNDVYLVSNPAGRIFSMKLSEDNQQNIFVENEKNILQELRGLRQVPKLIESGYYESRAYIIISQLGQDLNDLYYKRLRKFSISEAKFISLLCFKALKQVHNRRVIHGNIKPANISTGIYYPIKNIQLIGFEKAFKIFNEDDNSEVLNSQLRTTYADDLKDLLETIMFVYTGNLLWKYQQINLASINQIESDQQRDTRFDRESGEFPGKQILQKMFEYQRQLQFDQMPDYKFLIKLANGLPQDNDYSEQGDSFTQRHYNSALNKTTEIKTLPNIDQRIRNEVQRYKGSNTF